MKRMCLILLITSACGPAYWVPREEWVRRHAADEIRAHNEAGEEIRLRPAKLEDAAVVEEGPQALLVRPYHARYRTAAGFLTAGSVLFLASLSALLSQLAPCQGDEQCWLPHTVTGFTLASLSGVSLIVGTAMLPRSLSDAEIR